MNELNCQIARFRELTGKASVSPQEENEWGELCFILAPQLSNELSNLGDKLTRLEIELDHTHQAVQAARNYIYSIDDDLTAPKELYQMLERYAGDKEGKLQPCPACDSFQVYVADHCNYVVCRACKMTGPNGNSEEEAIQNWNQLPRRKKGD